MNGKLEHCKFIHDKIETFIPQKTYFETCKNGHLNCLQYIYT